MTSDPLSKPLCVIRATTFHPPSDPQSPNTFKDTIWHLAYHLRSFSHTNDILPNPETSQHLQKIHLPENPHLKPQPHVNKHPFLIWDGDRIPQHDVISWRFVPFPLFHSTFSFDKLLIRSGMVSSKLLHVELFIFDNHIRRNFCVVCVQRGSGDNSFQSIDDGVRECFNIGRIDIMQMSSNCVYQLDCSIRGTFPRR